MKKREVFADDQISEMVVSQKTLRFSRSRTRKNGHPVIVLEKPEGISEGVWSLYCDRLHKDLNAVHVPQCQCPLALL